jgi:hypothetical protein
MGTPAAIVVGAMLVAGALLLANHYEIAPAPDGSGELRLNRWTGEIEKCAKDAKVAGGEAASCVIRP